MTTVAPTVLMKARANLLALITSKNILLQRLMPRVGTKEAGSRNSEAGTRTKHEIFLDIEEDYLVHSQHALSASTKRTQMQ